MGVQGGDAYEHPPAARCSSKESPWRIFGSFLCEQKGTPSLNKETRPAGRNPSLLCINLLKTTLSQGEMNENRNDLHRRGLFR